MKIIRMDYSGIGLDMIGEAHLHFTSAADALAGLQKVSPDETVFLVFPAARQIPSSSILPLDRSIVQQLSQAVAYLPDLNRMALELAEGLVSSLPEQRLWIGFDDFLYRDIPEVNKYYALPYSLAVQYPRHGSDGLAHEWVIRKVQNGTMNGSTITCHLDQRPTLCIFRDGIPVDMSTGYSPVDGLPGEQSSGTIDPSLPMMMAKDGKSTAEIRQLLAGESGWQTIQDPGAIQLRFILKAIGALAASAGNLENLVFFGEPAESNQMLAQAVCTGLKPFGLSMTEGSLPSNQVIIPLTSAGSRVKAVWIPVATSTIFQEYTHLSE